MRGTVPLNDRILKQRDLEREYEWMGMERQKMIGCDDISFIEDHSTHTLTMTQQLTDRANKHRPVFCVLKTATQPQSRYSFVLFRVG